MNTKAPQSADSARNGPTPAVPPGDLSHRIVRVLAIAFAAYSIFEVIAFTMPPFRQRALFLLFPLAISFLLPVRSKTPPRRPALVDYGLAALSVICCAYILIEYDALIFRMGTPTSLDLVVGAIGVGLVMEATRRLVGLALPLIALTFIFYAYAGAMLPTSLGGHGGYEFNRIVTQSFLTMEGVFGLPLAVMFTYVFPFVLFGVVLQAIGGLGFAIDLAEALLGRYRGGPAKVAVVSSAVFGMVNGSAVANVVTAGSFTIPMMKKIGFQPHVAGAVEAVSSTGGQLMPPVMGAAAFMMAEYLGVPYLTVARAAIIPALLYYLALFATIHFYATKQGIGGAAIPDQRKLVRSILARKELYLFVVPVGCLIGFLIQGFTTTRSVTYAILAALLVSYLFHEHRLTPSRILKTLETAGRDSVSLCCATACVGIVIGLILMTALGSRFTPLIVDLSAGNIYLALVLVMFCSVLLGMGLPTTICYVLLATLAAPSLIDLGIQPLAAHMFILYFGMMSMVTPPSALAAYAAAMLANADIMRTGFTAWLFSLSGYLLPFMFVLNPAMLMVGAPSDILLALITGAIGVMALGAGVAGHVRLPLKHAERTALFAAAVLLIHFGWITDLLGLLLIAPVVIRHYNPFGLRSPSPI